MSSWTSSGRKLGIGQIPQVILSILVVARPCIFAIGKEKKASNWHEITPEVWPIIGMYRKGIDKDSPDKYSLSLTRFPGSVFTEYRYEGSIFIRIASWSIYFFKHILSVIIHVFMWLSARRASQFPGNHLYNHQCSWFPDYVILCVCIVLHDLLSVEHKGATSITLQHIFFNQLPIVYDSFTTKSVLWFYYSCTPMPISAKKLLK